MKKHLLLLLSIFFLGIVALQAQSPIQVSGFVTNEVTGEAVVNHDVQIMVNDSTIYYSTVSTNQNGFYQDSILPAGFVVNSLYILTNDLCTFGIHDTLIQNPGTVIQADFEICVDSLPNNSCQADFYYYSDSLDQYTYQFIDVSTANAGIESWYWDFGDGNTSTVQNPVHTFNAIGNFNVCLTITADSGSCTSIICQDIVISGGGGSCVADFYYVVDSLTETTVNFYDLSTPAGTIDSWYWDFGNGNTSTLQNPVHSFNAAGTYTVCLTITADSGSCTSTTCQDIVISGGGGSCAADFYYTVDSLMEATVNFYDLSTPVGAIDSWLWDFGDGNTSTVQNPVHTFNAIGNFNVCLTITADSAACTSIHCDVVEIGMNEEYQLGGNVFAGIYQLDNGFGYAYKSESGVITEVYSEMIDTLGYYLFYPMAAADYYVKIEPSPNSAYYGQYMPTYYGDVTHWEDAVLINLNQNIYTADINLVPMQQGIFGPGLIAGTIEHESTFKNNTPATDIQLMIRNDQGEYVGLKYTDDEGRFEFTSLAEGTYTLMAEAAGIEMTPEDFILSEENMTIDDIRMFMTEDQIYFGPNNIETLGSIRISDVYPNPARTSLKIDVGSEYPAMISVRIMNQLGQVLQENSVFLENQQTLDLNVNDLNPGLYFLEVISPDNYRLTRRFIKY